MSKVTPEVGDVWKHNRFGNLLYITDVGNNFIDFIGFDKYNQYCRYYRNCFSNINGDERYNKFTEFHTYLGKSKANIGQLFEVEDNGRCIEDNTPHAESTVLFKDLENEELT